MVFTSDQQEKTPKQQLHFNMSFGWDKPHPELSEGNSTAHAKTQRSPNRQIHRNRMVMCPQPVLLRKLRIEDYLEAMKCEAS